MMDQMIQDLQQRIYEAVIGADRKMTPGDVVKSIATAADVTRTSVRLAIRDLVRQGKLIYTYVYGTSYLEKSFDRPVRLSKRIIIKPPQIAYHPHPQEVVIDIAGGAAFGNGAHPTTYLVLRTLDNIFSDNRLLKQDMPLNALDVGTGTGILAIAMAKLGVGEVVGIDIDACAISEASHNVSLNGLAGQVVITDTPLEELTSHFSVIAANIAYPTLKRMAPLLAARTKEDSIVILSGFLKPATKDLCQTYVTQGFSYARATAERGWACLELDKPAQP
jgi:ribosomal protein L11 methyltransferase